MLPFGELSFTFLSSQWKCAESESSFRHLASYVPQVVSDTEIFAALEQWKLLAIENTPNVLGVFLELKTSYTQ